MTIEQNVEIEQETNADAPAGASAGIGQQPEPGKTSDSKADRKIHLIVKIYGFLCLLDGILTIPSVAMFACLVWWAISTDPSQVIIGTDPTLPVILTVLSVVVATANAVALIIFGRSLMKDRRRNAARWSYALIAATVVQLIITIMLQGIGAGLIQYVIQLAILLAISITVDPSLHQERELKRKLRDLEDRSAAEEGMLGRDREGKGYIELNFFNLFWVFVVCCVLGLLIEVVFHMVVVDPGVYQDRAGLLFGPFSPIYGFGAVLMTVALNRFYKANPLIIFAVSAVIGGVFEAAVSWFMQVGFGAVAWDYSGSTIFGLFPRPHRPSLRRPHEHAVHVHVGRARALLDQALPAVAAQAHQRHPVEDSLLLHHGVRRAHDHQRRHDASGPRLLVRAPLGRVGRHAGGAVLRRALRQRVHGAPLPEHDHHARRLRPR